ncbi:hypothetical protein [Microbulbifer mangrovi]|uniref:hypothetical protein n=1 Tax=Microbulbifer mangrovi TaxID=927787 RepID=UPI0013016C7B|nr:hypothetical protein [Microbulbifer mangrovi]
MKRSNWSDMIECLAENLGVAILVARAPKYDGLDASQQDSDGFPVMVMGCARRAESVA